MEEYLDPRVGDIVMLIGSQPFAGLNENDIGTVTEVLSKTVFRINQHKGNCSSCFWKLVKRRKKQKFHK